MRLFFSRWQPRLNISKSMMTLNMCENIQFMFISLSYLGLLEVYLVKYHENGWQEYQAVLFG